MPVVLAVLGVVLVVAAMTSGRVRDFLELSFTERGDPYVELAFPGGSTRAVDDACADGTPQVSFVFQITSRGVDQPRRIAYVASVSSAGAGASSAGSETADTSTTRSFVLQPGRRTTESATLATLARPWTLRVHLTGTGQTLRVHCRATA